MRNALPPVTKFIKIIHLEWLSSLCVNRQFIVYRVGYTIILCIAKLFLHLFAIIFYLPPDDTHM